MSVNSNSRTKNSLRNSKWGLINKVLIFLFPFIIKQIIIKQLGMDYLGLSGLFTSVLSVLSLAELGFSSAIVYSMYKPASENNKTLICALLNYFKKIYRNVGLIICALGIIISPFLTYFINGDIPQDINIYILYYIYLFNTVISYFLFSYRGCIFSAYQRNDIATKITIISKIALYFIQFFVLILFKNYYCYAIIIPLTTILNNLLTFLLSNKYFKDFKPYGKIDNELKQTIKTQVKGILVGRICSVLEGSLDVIIINWLIGLEEGGTYNSYLTVMNGLIGILSIIPESIRNSIGNSIASESVEKNYKDFVKFNFIYMFICGICTVCMFCLYQDFITICIGKKYLFPLLNVILICIYFYVLKAGDFTAAYFSSNGLWTYAKIPYLLEITVNLTLNIILGRLLGIAGIIISTITALSLTNIFIIPYLLNKHYFKTNLIKYYFSILYYFVATACISFVMNYLINLLPIGINWGTFIIKGIICFIISTILLLLMYIKFPYFKESKNFILDLLSKILKSKKKSGDKIES